MSDSTALTTTTANNAVSTRYNEADIRQEMSILRSAFPKLDADDKALRALIVAAKFSGLNPFRGEIYYVPKVGITVASKIKAADAVAWAQAHGNTLNIRFEKLNELHPEYQQVKPDKGDVCWLCIIVSSRARQEYFNWRIQVIDELKALGYRREELETELNKRCGMAAPETRAVGIVKAAEDFGDKYTKAQVFTRDDRAQKRALQKALNIGGYAAPDMRQYGGVHIEDERPAGETTVDAPYRVVESGVSGAVEITETHDADWKADMIALGKRAGGFVATASDTVGAQISAAQSLARDVLRKNGSSTPDEIAAATKALNEVIALAEAEKIGSNDAEA